MQRKGTALDSSALEYCGNQPGFVSKACTNRMCVYWCRYTAPLCGYSHSLWRVGPVSTADSGISGSTNARMKNTQSHVRTSLRSGFAWTLAGNLANGLSQWVILALVARLGSAEVLGEYALASALALPVAMLTHLNLRAVLATDVQGEHPFRDYQTVRLAVSAAGLLCAFAAGFVAFGPSRLFVAAILISLALQAENLSDLYYGAMQREHHLARVAQSMIARALVTVLLVGFALHFSPSVPAAATGFASGRLLSSLLFDVQYRINSSTEQTQFPWAVLKAALPLGAVLMLISLTANAPRYAIGDLLGTRELGGFAAVAAMVQAGATAINALGQSATTQLAQAWTGGNRPRFRKLAFALIAFSVLLGGAAVIGSAAFGSFILSAAYTAEFSRYRRLLTVMFAAAILSWVAVSLGYINTSTRAFRAQLPLLAAVAAVSFAVSYLTVPHLGLYGAVLALAVAALVQIAGQLSILQRSW